MQRPELERALVLSFLAIDGRDSEAMCGDGPQLENVDAVVSVLESVLDVSEVDAPDELAAN
jgi:hypothetical protein